MSAARATGRGPLRYGPGTPAPVLAPPGPLTAACADGARRTAAEPAGGGAPLREAAAGYWARRGLAVSPEAVVAAPSGAVLLLALLAAVGGDLLLPGPRPAWWAPQAGLLGHRVFTVPAPVDCGGVPDPYALLETVRRVRGEGGDPRLLVLSVADDPTGTVPPPELLHATVEAAAEAGLGLVSDESLRDLVHPGTATVLVSPAEMAPDRVTVLADLAGALLPPSWPAAVARFPDTGPGRDLRAGVLDVLMASGGLLTGPSAAAAALALGEPAPVADWVAASARLYARLAVRAYTLVRAAGALALPPAAGRCLYVDMDPLRPVLAAHGVRDAQELEEFLSRHAEVPAAGGHRFGDPLGALRARLTLPAGGLEPALARLALP
ncbi:pyridoxal phosphate-dependent aminotransferase [Streptomyces sp. NPDC050560]|uniref:pyridoxal phosphate-dependent aminotransferase n=1 Tax=Streptomyces sp. NPDC050560 TaxID=3365630 RepID=UPI0037B49B62